ncbi:short chain dehydrogenase [Sphingobium sp. TA15]|uniref:SDR-family protein n=1 Tax=Sphingobium indicum (strain DSM 16413 / CCM 7287 / MTCC 6362 / UT26 / NBRC 101211 / UT26S) TaxID=452662 RepID=D4Z0W0_SPHIU|nr:SDR family NAD(P)-dependent oxidoreductase [Sphingobium indicum]BAI96242.1 SDR-family protein [Sphingobium indicum UT26S]BDD65543.1 short chain dehydrogenase [Sphingobium sp. TA15]
MSGQVEGKIAIVTGAGSGIGKAMAEMFAKNGATVVVADISGDEEGVAKAIGGLASHFNVDVTQHEQVEALFADTVARHGRVDIVLNNAGVSGGFRPIHETAPETIGKVIDINLTSAFRVMRCGIIEMLKVGGGAIVNTASIAAFRATWGHSSYTASKGGVVAMTRAAAIEYADKNIRVNALCPGAIETAMLSGADPDIRERVRQSIPMGRFGQPEEMASVALFLASPAASYVTGVALLADGGRAG